MVNFALPVHEGAAVTALTAKLEGLEFLEKVIVEGVVEEAE